MADASPIPSIEKHPQHEEVIQQLPENWEMWPLHADSEKHGEPDIAALQHALIGNKKKSTLKFPKRLTVFISDPHADAEALEASLIASGVVRRTAPGLCNLKLTKAGKRCEVIIGGDCLDKGPSNLALLRSVKHLYRIDCKLSLLAGNHDLRLLMGLLSLKRDKDVGNQHFFVRMGKKVIPLFHEVFDNYLRGTDWKKHVPNEETCRQLLFPNDEWFTEFPFHAAGFLTSEGIEREVRKMAAKSSSFEQHCRSEGLSLQKVYAAALKCEQLFLKKNGEFNWFFKKMKLVEKRGSFLFLHAGLDDAMCHLICKNGAKHANKAFHRNLLRRDLFSFYYSPLANTFRTKYRKADLPLTDRGVKLAHNAGIKILVHGHVNRHHGQRIAVKNGLVHVEADITLDQNSRLKEGLRGIGVGATLIDRKQGIVGISGDYSHAKVFHPKHLYRMAAVAKASKSDALQTEGLAA